MKTRRRQYPSSVHETEVDLIPMMDLALNLTFFFVVLTTLAKDELARGINLPVSTVAFAAEETKIPSALSINVDPTGTVLSWGERLSLRRPADVERIDNLLAREALLARRQSQSPAKEIETVIIFRIDSAADCNDFQTLMDLCRKHKFHQFVLRSRAKDA